MTDGNLIYRFILRYGVSTVLVAMFAAVVYILREIEIEEKVTVEVIAEHDGRYYCYVKRGNFLECGNDSLAVSVDGKHNLEFFIEEISEEQSHYVYKLRPANGSLIDSMFRSDRKMTGYVITGKRRLWSLIFERWSDKLK